MKQVSKILGIMLMIMVIFGVSIVQAQTPTLINEIRIDQPSTDNDEYFELTGDAGTSLDGMTYLVIGDSTAGGSGVIEAVVNLTGYTIPTSGYFLAVESTFTLSTNANLTTTLNFENSENVTHMLVADFTGALDDDLDTNDDGILDSTPWSVIDDCVGVLDDVYPPAGGDYVYCPTTVGPDGSYPPGHAWQCTLGWEIGLFDPAGGDDTPGAQGGACSSGNAVAMNGFVGNSLSPIAGFVALLVTGSGLIILRKRK